MGGFPFDPCTRAQAVALAEYGIDISTVTEITGVSKGTIRRLRQRIREQGYDPDISKQLKLEYFKDRPRSGRPRKDGTNVKRKDGAVVVQEDQVVIEERNTCTAFTIRDRADIERDADLGQKSYSKADRSTLHPDHILRTKMPSHPGSPGTATPAYSVKNCTQVPVPNPPQPWTQSGPPP